MTYHYHFHSRSPTHLIYIPCIPTGKGAHENMWKGLMENSTCQYQVNFQVNYQVKIVIFNKESFLSSPTEHSTGFLWGHDAHTLCGQHYALRPNQWLKYVLYIRPTYFRRPKDTFAWYRSDFQNESREVRWLWRSIKTSTSGLDSQRCFWSQKPSAAKCAHFKKMTRSII